MNMKRTVLVLSALGLLGTGLVAQAIPHHDASAVPATAAEKNALLKSVIEKIDYQKTKRASRWTNPLDYLQITIFPRLPAGKI